MSGYISGSIKSHNDLWLLCLCMYDFGGLKSLE